VVQSNSVLNLVANRASLASVGVGILGAAALIKDFLSAGLGGVGLEVSGGACKV
jgi:hypothetical protein